MCSFVTPSLPHLFKSKRFGEIRAFFAYSLVQSKHDFDLWAIWNIKKIIGPYCQALYNLFLFLKSEHMYSKSIREKLAGKASVLSWEKFRVHIP